MSNEVGLRLKELRRWKNRPGLTRGYVNVYRCPPVQNFFLLWPKLELLNPLNSPSPPNADTEKGKSW